MVVLGMLLVDEELLVHVGPGDVVLRVEGPLPHVARVDGVDDDLTASVARTRRGQGSTWSTGTIAWG